MFPKICAVYNGQDGWPVPYLCFCYAFLLRGVMLRLAQAGFRTSSMLFLNTYKCNQAAVTPHSV